MKFSGVVSRAGRVSLVCVDHYGLHAISDDTSLFLVWWVESPSTSGILVFWYYYE